MLHNLRHHWQVLTSAWRRRKAIDDQGGRQLEEVEFLPAALEVRETPPSPIGRAIVLIIIAVFVAAVIWAVVGKMDVVAVAQGKIIPSGNSKIVQPFEAGIVEAIHVEEGQEVERGDVLIELDTTTMHADQDRIIEESMAARATLARTETLLGALSGGKETLAGFNDIPDDVAPAILRAQRSLMLNQYAEYLSDRRSLEAEMESKRAERNAIEEDIKRLDTIIPILDERTDGVKQLASKNFAARNQYLELEQERVEYIQNRAALRDRLEGTRAAVDRARARLASLNARFRKTILTEQTETEARLRALEKELFKAETRIGLQRLKAPVDGVVQQLAVHTVGGVVEPAQTLMVVVPGDTPLEVEAFIPNKDVGFVQEGQQVEIKVDAFPFTRYGTIEAEMMQISNDAMEKENLGWVFGARVSMAESTLLVEGKQVNLSPGMSVTVEVKTGKRRVIDYFLSPLMRGLDQSIRER